MLPKQNYYLKNKRKTRKQKEAKARPVAAIALEDQITIHQTKDVPTTVISCMSAPVEAAIIIQETANNM